MEWNGGDSRGPQGCRPRRRRVWRGPAAVCTSFPEPEGARPRDTQTLNLLPREL